MKFSIVCGSHRPNSQSLKIGKFAQHLIEKMGPSHSSYLLDLGTVQLPHWDENGSAKKVFETHAQEIRSSDALIVVAPEWGGMVPAALKNFFLLCSSRELGHKPGYLVAVTSGIAGSYPIAELRMSSFKNNGLCYMPEHLIIRYCEKIMNDVNKEEGEHDTYLRKRMQYGLTLLESYATALKSVRDSGRIDYKTYPNGM